MHPCYQWPLLAILSVCLALLSLPLPYEVVNNTAYNYMRQYEPETRFNANMIRQNQDTTLSSSSQVRAPAGSGSPDMDDALELISQDIDYMERLELDFQIQCLLCTWTGPSVVLEPHIRKEHQSEIHTFSSTEWNVTFSLASTSSRIIRSPRRLYCVTATTQRPHALVRLASISEPDTPEVGTMTIYNKVTGEPFSWAGVVPTLTRPSRMEYGCLRVKLSDLDLLPNSANVDLISSQQASDSNRAVCGQPELDDIHITVFVKI